MSDETYEQYVERRRADKTIPRKNRKHLWLVVIAGLGFYLFTNWISRDLDRAVEAHKEHKGAGNPWAAEKPAPNSGRQTTAQ